MKQLILMATLVASLLAQVCTCLDLTYGYQIHLHHLNSSKTNKLGYLNSRNSIADLKDLIMKQEKIELADQRLIYDSFTLIIDNELKLSEIARKEAQLLIFTLLEPLGESGIIHHGYNYRIKNASVSGALTVKEFKDIVGEGRLFFAGMELKDESKTLDDYQLHKEAFVMVLRLTDPFPVFVTTQEKGELDFGFDSTISVGDLKHELKGHVDIPIENMKLFDGAKELTDYKSKLIDCCTFHHREGLKIRLES